MAKQDVRSGGRRVAILAYGSLIDNPGDEIRAARADIESKAVATPFNVEFARTSKEREGAPTLVPVDDGGASVEAQLIFLSIDSEEAAQRLWRREINRVGSGRKYRRPAKPNRNSVIIDSLVLADVIALYARIAPNISPLTPEELARLAVESARRLRDGRDGISYLIDAKRNGIITPLSAAYEDEIKRLTESASLEEALASVTPPRTSESAAL